MLKKKPAIPWAFREEPTNKQFFTPSFTGIHFSRKGPACLGLSWPVFPCLGLSWPVFPFLGLSWLVLARFSVPTWLQLGTPNNPCQNAFPSWLHFWTDFSVIFTLNLGLIICYQKVHFLWIALGASLISVCVCAYVWKKMELTQVHSAKPPQPSGLVRCLMKYDWDWRTTERK